MGNGRRDVGGDRDRLTDMKPVTGWLISQAAAGFDRHVPKPISPANMSFCVRDTATLTVCRPLASVAKPTEMAVPSVPVTV